MIRIVDKNLVTYVKDNVTIDINEIVKDPDLLDSYAEIVYDSERNKIIHSKFDLQDMIECYFNNKE